MTAIVMPVTRKRRGKKAWSYTIAPDLVRKFEDALAARHATAARQPQHVYDAAESDEERAAAIYYLIVTCGIEFVKLPLSLRMATSRLASAAKAQDPTSWVASRLPYFMK